jgi:hypothetical protein
VALFGVVAALTTMAFGAGSAQAQLEADFTDARLKVGGIAGNGLDILEPPDEIVLQATPTSAPPVTTFMTTPGQFIVPQFDGVVGGIAYIEVDFVPTENVTGTIDSTNPAAVTVVTNPSDYLATMLVDLTDPNGDMSVPGADGDTCELGDAPGGADTPDVELAFNTTQAYPSPFNGDPFDIVGAELGTDALDNGAVVATWADLPDAIHTAGPDGPGDDCALVNGLTSGRGALWIASELTTPALNAEPAPPETPATPAPGPKKCKKGQKLKKGKCVKKKKKKKKKKK